MSATVLVVEDEVDLLFTIALSLELNGYRVVKAASGEEAVDMVEKERPDAVVLDIMMPGRDGLDVLRSLRADPATRDIPVVLLTAKATNQETLEGWRAGAAGYTTKPFEPAELIRYVSHLLDQTC